MVATSYFYPALLTYNLGDPRPCIPYRVMASSAVGLKLGVFGILLTRHTYLTNHSYFAYRQKPEDPQFEPHVGIQMEQALGSPLYISALHIQILAYALKIHSTPPPPLLHPPPWKIYSKSSFLQGSISSEWISWLDTSISNFYTLCGRINQDVAQRVCDFQIELLYVQIRSKITLPLWNAYRKSSSGGV